jgi:hypothetical protein
MIAQVETGYELAAAVRVLITKLDYSNKNY